MRKEGARHAIAPSYFCKFHAVNSRCRSVLHIIVEDILKARDVTIPFSPDAFPLSPRECRGCEKYRRSQSNPDRLTVEECFSSFPYHEGQGIVSQRSG